MTTFLLKETVRRLLKDVKCIIQSPLTEQGIYYSHDEEDILKGYAMIVGPEDTPYFGGYYFFELTYPVDYPHSPPVVNYCTNGERVRFNPNLYCCGKVCISLLNTWRGDQWTSCQSISSVLLTICTVLSKNPLLNEPGILINNCDVEPYNDIIEYSNLNVAVCDILMKKRGIYQPFFDKFYGTAKELFKTNYDKLMAFAESKKNGKFATCEEVSTKIYDMNIFIDYAHVILKLEISKQKLDL